MSENCEIIDGAELARRWAVPKSWVEDQVRSRAADPLPHFKMGKYVRFQWGSDELESWLLRRFKSGRR
jgi:hypothetical protein